MGGGVCGYILYLKRVHDPKKVKNLCFSRYQHLQTCIQLMQPFISWHVGTKIQLNMCNQHNKQSKLFSNIR